MPYTTVSFYTYQAIFELVLGTVSCAFPMPSIHNIPCTFSLLSTLDIYANLLHMLWIH